MAEAFAERTVRFAAPKWVVFKALIEEQDRWVRLNPGEVMPRVVSAELDVSVIWSSFWPVSPDDRIEFELARDAGGGTAMTFRWRSDKPPDDRGINFTRQRLNRKFAADLRGWVDGRSSPISWDEERR